MSNANINNNEELWRAFGEEVGEQLDKLDIELTKGTAACDIHQVFRDFHTIKSSCAMLDMGSMKDLAHVSEDYLDLVRKDTVKLTEQAIDILLSAVETLKRQLLMAMETRQNPASAANIMASIKHLISGPLASPGNRKKIPESVKPAASSDLEQLAEAARPTLLELARARQLTPALKNQLINFGNMAQLLDFPLLQVLCRDIVLSFRTSAEDSMPATLLHHEVDLMDRIRDLQQESSVDLGALAAEAAFRITLEKDFIRLILDLVEIFSGLDHMELPVWLAGRHEMAENSLEKLALFAGLFGLPELRHLFSYVIQVIRSARRGYFQPGADFPRLLKQVINHPYADLLQQGEVVLCDALVQCRKNLEQATRAADFSPVDCETLQDKPAGKTLCEIDIYMDGDTAVVEQLVEWISNHGHMINTTSTCDTAKSNSITFKVTFDLSAEQITEQLQMIDRDGLCFQLREKTDSQVIATGASSTSPEVFKTITDMPQLLGSTLRIGSQAIDNLVTQVGEVVMARNMIGNLINREQYEILSRKCRYLLEQEKSGSATRQQIEELKAGLLELMAVRDDLVLYDLRLHAAITQVQQKVLDLREMPIASVFNRLPNIVRKVSHSIGKSISLKMTGQDACIDKGMMDILLKTLATLLQHLIINGANTQELSVQARIQGNQLKISIVSDCSITGQEALIEVKKWLDRIGGLLVVDHARDDRTEILLDFPRTVAMQTLLLTRSGQSTTALSERNIIEIRRFKGASVHTLQGRASLSWRGKVIPLLDMKEWVGRAPHDPAGFNGDSGSLVIVASGTQYVGIRVDEIMGLRDAFVPENHSVFSALSHINGSTILGDGSVVFLLNVEHLMQSLYGSLHKLFHGRDEHGVGQHRAAEQEKAA